MVIVNQGILKIWQDICWLGLVYRVAHEACSCLPIKYSIMLPGQQTNFSRHVMVIAGMYSQRHFRQLAIQGYVPAGVCMYPPTSSPLLSFFVPTEILTFFWRSSSRAMSRSNEWSMELRGARDEPLSRDVSCYLRSSVRESWKLWHRSDCLLRQLDGRLNGESRRTLARRRKEVYRSRSLQE